MGNVLDVLIRCIPFGQLEDQEDVFRMCVTSDQLEDQKDVEDVLRRCVVGRFLSF